MSKHVLVVSTSLRKAGNSDLLADEFACGAKDAGNSVEKISLHGKSLGFCQGCLACQKTGRCVIQDDANELLRNVRPDENDARQSEPLIWFGLSIP